MTIPAPLAELWRADLLESLHTGHVAICDESGELIEALGDPDALIYPRSSCKMVQALPLIESGAADAHGLRSEHLALACASHIGAATHTDHVSAWLGDLGLGDDDFRCGPQWPDDADANRHLIKTDASPCQVHNNCSGKHAGFLTLNRHLGGSADYIDPDHPVQAACRDAFERATGMDTPGYGIDGCSAPNFQTTVQGLAHVMARFACAPDNSAEARLRDAMTRHPELVAGEGRACTELMRAMNGKVAIKTGAEGVFVAIVPEKRLGVALKVTDGATRASECAIAAILVRLGVLDADHPATRQRMNAPMMNRRGIAAAEIRPSAALAQG